MGGRGSTLSTCRLPKQNRTEMYASLGAIKQRCNVSLYTMLKSSDWTAKRQSWRFAVKSVWVVEPRRIELLTS